MGTLTIQTYIRQASIYSLVTIVALNNIIALNSRGGQNMNVLLLLVVVVIQGL